MFYSHPFYLRDHRALCQPRLIEGLMHEAVQEEEHDYNPPNEESQKVLPPKQVQKENQYPHV